MVCLFTCPVHLERFMRRNPDGSYWLVRNDPKLIKQFDKEMDKIGTLRWMPKNTGFKLERFKNLHVGKIAIIVGKGPSLDKLNKEMVSDNKVFFFINDSVKKANELEISGYSVQQDGNLMDTCILKQGVHLLSFYARGWNPKATLYNTEEDLKIKPNSPTVLAAIKLAKFMGVSEIQLFAFDALKTNKIVEYANIIGYSSNKHKKPAERFFIQKKIVETELKNFKWRYI